MKRNVWTVPIRVSVPTGMDATEVQNMMEEMIGEALHVCSELADSDAGAEVKDAARRINQCEFNTCAAEYDHSEGTDLECRVDVDDACYCGDENDGVYYQAFEDDDGKWWLSAIVDSDTGSFVDALIEGDGPYDSEEHAEQAGRDAAVEWCIWNDVNYCPEPEE